MGTAANAGGDGATDPGGPGTLHGEGPPWRSVPLALLSFHFLLLITPALSWVFGRRINEK